MMMTGIQIELRTPHVYASHSIVQPYPPHCGPRAWCYCWSFNEQRKKVVLLLLLFSFLFVPEADIIWWIMIIIITLVVSFRHSKWWRCQFSVVKLRQKIHLSFHEGNNLSFKKNSLNIFEFSYLPSELKQTQLPKIIWHNESLVIKNFNSDKFTEKLWSWIYNDEHKFWGYELQPNSSIASFCPSWVCF